MTLLDQSFALRRPPVLVRAARFAAADYRRDAAHKRFLLQPKPISAERALAKLLRIEGDLDARRRDGEADYSAGRHVMILAALMAETARLHAQTLRAVPDLRASAKTAV